MRKLVILYLATVVGTLSSFGTVVLMDDANKNYHAPIDFLKSERATKVIVASSLPGTMVAGLRWLRYRFF